MPFYIKDLIQSNESPTNVEASVYKQFKSNGKKDKFIYNDPDEFVRVLAPIYIQKLNKYGIDLNYAPQLIAQACLESAWGQKPIGWETNTPTYNFIGEKSIDGQGYTSATHEYDSNKKYKTKSVFRTWNSLEDAIDFHVWKFSRGRWTAYNIYDPVNIDGFPHRVQKAGYATAPDYGNNMIPFVNKVKTILSK